MKQLFPKEIIEYTTAAHHARNNSRSKIIYTLLLATIVIALLLLPFINIQIYTNARGMLKPDKERVKITTLQSGKVIHSNIIDNQKVQKGDTLLMINTNVVNQEIKRSTTQLEENTQFIADCNYLINAAHPTLEHIQSVRYQKEYLYFTQKLQELHTTVEKNKGDHQRNKKLYDKGVIAKVDYDESAYEYQLAVNNLKQYKKQQKNNWQTKISEYQNILRELKGQLTQLEQNQKELIVTAPIDGILKNVMGIEQGSLILSGNPIAEISPDTGLIAECYVSPSDIGLISKEKPVNFQIDAFNYNQWGLATGNILEISKDIDIINEQAVFKIRCELDQKHLELKNGFEGRFNKGMTLNARFQLTERTLFDLLYDKVDDWLNPSSPRIAQN